MKDIPHFYSLNPDWQKDFAEGLGTKVINNKIIIIPETIGNGHTYFIEVTPNISALFFDFELVSPVQITRLSSDHHLYIFHYDISEQKNVIKINNISYEVGSFEKLELDIIDNKLGSVSQPDLNKRLVALRIFVDKTLLTDFVDKYHKKEIKQNTRQLENDALYHYGNIDSNSILLIKSIKNKPIHDISFEPLLKGVCLKLLGNFFNKFYNSLDNTRDITDIDLDAVMKTKEYLLNNLYGPFPSVTFIAAMAGVSESKYKILFKKCFGDTPNNFFIKEKMFLAQKLFKSGQFKTINDVIYTLSYSKTSYFTAKYFEIFERKPKDDFIKKAN